MTDEPTAETDKPKERTGGKLRVWIATKRRKFGRWPETIIGGTIAAVLAGMILYWVVPRDAPTTGNSSTSTPSTSSSTPPTTSSFSPPPPPIVVASPPDAPIVSPQDSPIAVKVDHGPRCAVVKTPAGVEVDGDESTVDVTVQGKADSTVVLTGMRVTVSQRTQPAGTAMFCGGIEPVRDFTVDLDQPNSPVFADVGPDGKAPVSFPLTVSIRDTETLRLHASTQSSDCTWTIELGWISEGRSGIYVIDDNGAPFRTIGTSGLAG